MTLVLDSSVAVAFVIEDERTPAVETLMRRVADGGAWVPGLWPLEVANVLQMAVRRKRMSTALRDHALRSLAGLSIEVDGETHVRAWSDGLRLAIEHELTVYDAAYIELALRRGLPLATADRQLVAAAARTGVETL